MRELPAELAELYPWTGKRLAVDGGELHFLDEGPRDAPVLLAVHGNPTWSFYWRALVHTFSDRYRVVVPDHIGCGLSDKPQDWPYRLDGHIRNLVSLIEHLDLQDINLMVHDWGGAIGMGAATRVPERMGRFIITNTAAFPMDIMPWPIGFARVPLFKDVAVRGFNGFSRVFTRSTTTVKPMAPLVRKGLEAPYRSWDDRIATLRFVEDIPMKSSHPSWDTLVKIEEKLPLFKQHPMLILWGNRDWCFSPEFRKIWEGHFPDARVEGWDDASHSLMEDVTDRVLEQVEGFLPPVG